MKRGWWKPVLALHECLFLISKIKPVQTEYLSLKPAARGLQISSNEVMCLYFSLFEKMNPCLSPCKLIGVPDGVYDLTNVCVWACESECVCDWRQHMDSALLPVGRGTAWLFCEPQLDLWPLEITQRKVKHSHTLPYLHMHAQMYVHSQLASCPLGLSVPHRDAGSHSPAGDPIRTPLRVF